MKLNEIRDIADYRKGDELDSRSPHYKEPPEDDFEEAKVKFTTEDGAEVKADVDIGIRKVASKKYTDESEDAYYVANFKITSVRVDGHDVDPKKWTYENKITDDQMHEMIADELSDKVRYKRWKGSVLPDEDKIK